MKTPTANGTPPYIARKSARAVDESSEMFTRPASQRGAATPRNPKPTKAGKLNQSSILAARDDLTMEDSFCLSLIREASRACISRARWTITPQVSDARIVRTLCCDMADEPPRTAALFRALLRYWRGARGMSQLDLGLAAEVSARQISFLE